MKDFPAVRLFSWHHFIASFRNGLAVKYIAKAFNLKLVRGVVEEGVEGVPLALHAQVVVERCQLVLKLKSDFFVPNWFVKLPTGGRLSAGTILVTGTPIDTRHLSCGQLK